MATPEISYHCALCGATIRLGVQSCPHCTAENINSAAPDLVKPQPARMSMDSSSSWMLQPDLVANGVTTATKDAYESYPATLSLHEVSEEPYLKPPVYHPSASVTAPLHRPEEVPEIDFSQAPVLEIPAEYGENEFLELADGPLALEGDAAAPEETLDDAETEDKPKTAEEVAAKLAQIKSTTPVPTVTVLDGPPQVRRKKRRRRHGPPTLRERLAYRIDQLRGVPADATRKMAPTVAQLRHTSNAVLDRASDDPSTRFLLFGLLLVALAVFIFILSFFLG